MYGLTEIGSRAVNGVHDVWSDRDWKQGVNGVHDVWSDRDY